MQRPINLISDTVTKPSAKMLEYMMQAEVGDDVFGEDPTVNQLEERMAQLFHQESGLFCPSGTMANQIAIKAHTQGLDEMICDIDSHVYQYEVGGYAFNSGIAVNLLQGHYGKITAEQVQQAIKPKYDWLPLSRLVCIENTCNKGGGSYYTLDEMASIANVCKKHQLKYHLDGARIFNALIASGDDAREVGTLFDSISVCLSKGLGAPVGSVLLGSKEFIRLARRYRKVFGGGMRQAGYLAAAGLYALDHHVDRLSEDHQKARLLSDSLQVASFVKQVKPIHTNIVIFELKGHITTDQFIHKMKSENILVTAFGPQMIRMVTHRDVSDKMILRVIEVLSRIN